MTLAVRFLLVGLLAVPALAAAEDVVPTAPVVVDGVELFRIRGIAALPAEERAAAIARRIRDAARDPAFDAGAVAATPIEAAVEIGANGRVVLILGRADAETEGVDLEHAARAYVARIRTAIEGYRRDRTPSALARSAGIALGTVLLLVAALFVLRRVFRRLDTALERRYGERVRSLRVKAFPVVDAQRIWELLRAGLRALHAVLGVVAVVVALEVALEVFPWTRPISRGLLAYIVDPLRTMGSAVLAYVPKAVFLAVLAIVTRWTLKILKLFFDGIDRGTIAFEGFEADWALPTYRLVRLVVLAFVIVVAYPYLPGSDSGAFKGVSLFLGVMFSLGSTSAISNVVAGYSLTYRRAFKVGDVIRVGDHMGTVTQVRLVVTHLRTIKNEEVVIPNSVILNSQIVNYSTIARKDGLILHTTVGIGYEVPWRQVEAMLLEAARRTPGLRTEPPPFVLQTALGDFAVSYQLNVYSDSPTAIARTYSALHRNIQDAFNEYGVQIMTPAYEGDPAEPKVVPKARWYDAPARPPETGP